MSQKKLIRKNAVNNSIRELNENVKKSSDENIRVGNKSGSPKQKKSDGNGTMPRQTKIISKQMRRSLSAAEVRNPFDHYHQQDQEQHFCLNELSKSCTNATTSNDLEPNLGIFETIKTKESNNSVRNDEIDNTVDQLKTNSTLLKTTMLSPLTPVSVSASTSFSWSRERALEQQVESLCETLKDTEERLQSLRIQYDNVSQRQRKLRDTNNQMQDEMERLKIDAQHLHECANILRTELQAARKDRADAFEIQKQLQREFDESRIEKRRACDEVESNAKQILDLQRQCKEMERILARKNPDAMGGLLGKLSLNIVVNSFHSFTDLFFFQILNSWIQEK